MNFWVASWTAEPGAATLFSGTHSQARGQRALTSVEPVAAAGALVAVSDHPFAAMVYLVGADGSLTVRPTSPDGSHEHGDRPQRLITSLGDPTELSAPSTSDKWSAPAVRSAPSAHADAGASSTPGTQTWSGAGLVLSDASSLVVAAGPRGLLRFPLDANGAFAGPDTTAPRRAPRAADPYAGRLADRDWAERNVRSEDPEPDFAELMAELSRERDTADADRARDENPAALALGDLMGRAGVHLSDDGTVQSGSPDATDDADPIPERPSDVTAVTELATGLLVSTDRGRDVVQLWGRRGQGFMALSECVLPFGVAPGAVIAHRSGFIYVVAEASAELCVLHVRGTELRLHAVVPLLADGLERGDRAAALTESADGATLHSVVRGSGRIATLRVDGDGSRPRAMADVPTPGAGPLTVLWSAGVLCVADPESGVLSSHTIDRAGLPDQAGQEWRIPGVCALIAGRS
ncbi:MAG: beta-propeller fold lactonase family protein [Mycetocola sp.]